MVRRTTEVLGLLDEIHCFEGQRAFASVPAADSLRHRVDHCPRAPKREDWLIRALVIAGPLSEQDLAELFQLMRKFEQRDPAQTF